MSNYTHTIGRHKVRVQKALARIGGGRGVGSLQYVRTRYENPEEASRKQTGCIE